MRRAKATPKAAANRRAKAGKRPLAWSARSFKNAMAEAALRDMMAHVGDLPRERVVELYLRCVEILASTEEAG